MFEIKANMAGSIWKVNVEEGSTVKAGEEVIILESMKMEIPITTEKDGTIEQIHVAEGDFVNEGDVLLTVKE